MTGEYKPREHSASVTAEWNGRAPEEPLDGAETLAGFDVDIPEEPKVYENRTTNSAPLPADSVLARLPSREVEWVPVSQVAGSEARSIEALADAIGRIRLYAGLPRNDIERRAQFYYELWVSQPDEKSDALLENLSARETIIAGDVTIPQSWVIRQEAALNARLRLLENHIYRDLPDTYSEEMSLTRDEDIRKFDEYAQRFPERVISAIDGDGEQGKHLTVEILRDGPAKLIQRSAMAMVSNFRLLEDLADEIFSRDGLARILIVHSDRSPIEKLAYKISRLIDFSNRTAGQLNLLAKRYLETWEDLPQFERARIAYDDLKEQDRIEYIPTKVVHTDLKEKGKVEYVEFSNFQLAQELDMETPVSPIVKDLSQAVVNVTEPPDSWLRWQNIEAIAWSEAANISGEKDVGMNFQARAIHRQLFVSENQDFMGMLVGDRYRLCKFIALGMAEARKDPEFSRYVSENGYIAPEGIDIIMKKGGVRDSGMDLRMSRSRGLRLTRERLKDREAPNVWNSKVGWDHVK